MLARSRCSHSDQKSSGERIRKKTKTLLLWKSVYVFFLSFFSFCFFSGPCLIHALFFLSLRQRQRSFGGFFCWRSFQERAEKKTSVCAQLLTRKALNHPERLRKPLINHSQSASNHNLHSFKVQSQRRACCICFSFPHMLSSTTKRNLDTTRRVHS